MLKVIELMRSNELFPRYERLVRLKERDGLLLLNYSTECQYANAWDEVTSVCRGLIVDASDHSIVARPFDKFFNLGEHPSSRREALPDLPFMIFEKVDGSLGTMYRDRRGDPWLATRGGFDGPQALRGTEMLRGMPNLDSVPDGYTAIFEIVYKNQHTSGDAPGFSVINYGFEGLVLLGLRHRETGEEPPWEETVALADRIGARLPKVHFYASLDAAHADAKGLPRDQEGFVLRFKNGLRVKLKGAAYLELSALIWDVTDQRILASQISGSYADLVRALPEEFRKEVERAADRNTAAAEALRLEAEEVLRAAPAASDRKAFAAWVNANVRKPIRGAVFNLYDGKPPNWYKLSRDLA